MDIEKKIKTHTEEVMSGKVRCRYKQCPWCHVLTQDFRVREVRERIFLVVLEELVRRFESYVVRWMCGLCKKRFTGVPEFALPYKRHVKPTILPLAEEYLEGPGATYQGVVGLMGYPAPEPKPRKSLSREEQEAQDQTVYSGLAPSTLWHWVTSLGEMEKTCRSARERIRRKDPSVGVDVEVAGVAARKYKSERRRRLLERAQSLLRTSREHERLFGIDLLPKFAMPGLRA